MKILFIVLISLVVLAVGGMFYMGKSSQSMESVATGSGSQLGDCPASPNCVSSSATGEHAYPAWTLAPGVKWSDVVVEVAKMDGVSIIKENPGTYLHTEFKSQIFGFVDDLELRKSGAELAIRSASRVGESDLGANRKRADALGARLAAAGLLASG